MTKRSKKPTTKLAKAKSHRPEKLPIIEHLYELRRRLFVIAASVMAISIAAYALERHIVAALLRPSHGQQFIYTSPIGGMNFLFGVCLDVGLVVATPIIVYQLLAFVSPLMRKTTHRFLVIASSLAGLVALGGVAFGYFIGLPSALNFLLHQFTTVQVRPLITIQSYLQFVALYLFGSALMFQLPLILFTINRIKPLKPSGLFKYERHLIVSAFLLAFIMNPTPNVVDQLFVVVPIIIMYQFSIGLIWLVNRQHQVADIPKVATAPTAQAIPQRVTAAAVPKPVTPVAAAVTVPLTPVFPIKRPLPKPVYRTRPASPHRPVRPHVISDFLPVRPARRREELGPSIS